MKRKQNTKQMTRTAYYRTGQAAEALGISNHQMRRLCEAGLVDAEPGPGGHWKIPVAEIERLKQEGVPIIPAGVDDEDYGENDEREAQPEPESPRRNLLGPPSSALIGSAEAVELANNKLKLLRIEKDTEVQKDFFRERKAAAEREERAWEEREAAKEAARNRQQWQDGWLQWALDRVPSKVPQQYRLGVQREVNAVLVNLPLSTSRPVLERLVEAAVDKGLQPWQSSQDSERAIAYAVETLPCWAKLVCTPTVWQVRARQEAAAAVGKMPAGAPYESKRMAAIGAVQPISQEYEEQELRKQVIGEAIFFWNLTTERTHEAKDAVRAAIEMLPKGSSETEMRKARQAALKPFEVEEQLTKERLQLERMVEAELGHIRTYLNGLWISDEIDFKDAWDLSEYVEEIRPEVREIVLKELEGTQNLAPHKIRQTIEAAIEQFIN